jgi:LDH2 family malate/lactate/ureidoglycolate dehydrogenase
VPDTERNGEGGDVRLPLADARSLAIAAARSIGVTDDDARIIAEHVLDAELRGHVGLSRLIPLAEHYAAFQGERRPIQVLHDRPSSALVDGGNQPGMVVAERATRLCIQKAKAVAVAVVAANNHRYSGLLAYYVERVALEGLVAVAVATGYPRVAPHGGRVALLGTNPLAFGFPTAADPIVVDLATSAISGGELLRRARANEPLPTGTALDVAGRPTLSAAEALEGVLVPWGGHRGFGLAVAVQLLGVLCGMEPSPQGDDGWSFLIIALDPSLFGPRRSFDERAAGLADMIRASPPAEGFDKVRMPFDRSRAERRLREVEGVVLSAAIHARLAELARSRPR